MTLATMAPPDATEAMRAVDDLWHQELALCGDYLEVDAKVADAQLRRASAVLDARLAGKQDPKKDELASIRAQLENLVLAVDEARRRRREAIASYFGCEAEALQRQASDKRSERATILEKTERLLAELLEHEGCEYVVRTVEPSLQPGILTAQPMPRSSLLELEAQTLDASADAILRRDVSDTGVVEASSVDQMLEALRGWDPLAFAPTIVSTVEWARAAYAQQSRRMGATNSPNMRIRLELRWKSGRIDEGASRSFVPTLDA